MSAPQNFRSAFNGFHREDVVRYLEYLNNKHTAQVNQLTTEADILRSRVEALEAQPAADLAQLEQERDALQARVEELEAQLASQPAAEQPAVTYSESEELEVYRRAERAERMAIERAELIYHQTGNALSEAARRMQLLSGQVVPQAETALEQLNQLQKTVSESLDALKEAISVLETARPNN